MDIMESNYFFVLSGFLLALPFAKYHLNISKKPSLKDYFYRRLSRLEPPYLFAILLLFIGNVLTVGRIFFEKWPNLFYSLLYQHNIVYGKPSIITAVAWSLEVEVQFYCLAPVLTSFFLINNKLKRRLLMGLFGVMFIGLRSFLPYQIKMQVMLSIFGFMEYFIVGFILVDLYINEWKESSSHGYRWDIVTLIGWPILIIIFEYSWLNWAISPMIFILYFAVFRGNISNLLFCNKYATTLGGMCYSMYLTHYAVISISGKIARNYNIGSSLIERMIFNSIFMIPLIILVSSMYFIVLERPCMNPKWPSKMILYIKSKYV